MARLVFLLLYFPVYLYGGNITLQQANNAYHNQEYKVAADLYYQMIKDGYHHQTIYYNAGNAFYKTKQYGKARWAYMKAKLNQESNILIDENLALTLSKAQLSGSDVNTSFFSKMLHRFIKLHTYNKWAAYTLLLFMLYAVVVSIRRVYRTHPFLSIERIIFFLFLIHVLGSVLSWIHKRTTHQAIVIGNHKINDKLTLKDGDLIELKLLNYESKVYNFTNLKKQSGVIARDKVWLLY